MSDWIDESVEKQQNELRRQIDAARSHSPCAVQKKAGDTVVCSKCLEPIPTKRLNIKPDATHCTPCLAELEG
jgi:RNA polymerase-binding transcription factor DksA